MQWKKMSFQEWDARCYIFFALHKFYNEYGVEAHKQMFENFRRKKVNEKEKNEIPRIFAVRYGNFVWNWNEH